MPLPPTTRWTTEILVRMRRYLVLKLVGIFGVTWLFFVAYFHLLRHPVYPVTVMPLTPLDDWLPFVPQTLPAYLSLWLYVGVAPGLQLNLRELLAFGAWITSLCLAGLAIFYWWPTTVPPLSIARAAYPGFAMLQGVDSAGNACPSMHVAVAMFSAIRIEQLLRWTQVPALLRVVNWAWFAAVAFSTLAVKQHVVWDVVAGTALGMAFAAASLIWRPADRHA